MESLKVLIQDCLVSRAPNSLTVANIASLLAEDPRAVESELKRLCISGLVIERPGNRSSDYVLPSYANIPVKNFVAVGGIKVPRLLSDERARPEELNIFVEVLARRILQSEEEAESRLDERMKNYWANIVTLFGAFIGVFSLIVGFLKTVQIEQNSTFWSVLALSCAQTIPLAIVLGGFIWLLKRLFR